MLSHIKRALSLHKAHQRVIYKNVQWNCPPVWRIQDFCDDDVRWKGSISITITLRDENKETTRAQFHGSASKNQHYRSRAFHANVKCISRLSREFWLVRTPCYKAFFAYTPSAENQRLHSKRRMVTISIEFGGKQYKLILVFDKMLNSPRPKNK